MSRTLAFACAAALAVSPLHVALAQDGQEAAVMKVIENVFPGYSDPGYADCILQNANESQTEQIVKAGDSGSFRAAEEPLKEVAEKNTTQSCIIAAGLPRFPF
ncbi:hypothetical protein ACRDNQ_01425 [Palleronia sp. KMU-117]|uniref:hypothetical protein n=1 Tax=Palleronia sp. KMU-117 TaxID=3434108 RepID=UPI003D70CB74